MQRKLIEKPISLGVRSIDGLLTCGEGQRMGIFAAAGGGKVPACEADSLCGRGRNRSCSDWRTWTRSARVHRTRLGRRRYGAFSAGRCDIRQTSHGARKSSVRCDFYRRIFPRPRQARFAADGLRHAFAHAQREIGLAAGEPPTRRGYPPSVLPHCQN